MSSSSPGNPRSLKRLSQKRTVAPHRPILAAIPGALRPSAACWMICARRTSPAPSLCERVIRPSLCASSSLNARTRRVIATSPARTGTPSNAQDSEKSHPTCRMHHLLGQLAPMVRRIEAPGMVPRMLDEMRPFEGRLARLTATANAYGSDLTASDQQWMLLLHWAFSGIAAALVISGLAFIVLLFFQNRLLATSYRRVSALAHDLQAAKNIADAASEAKSRFLATMSHELRTPLNAVIGFSEIIASETVGPIGKPAFRLYATGILTAGRHMLELVNDVLTMAKLDAGRYELDLAPMNLHDAVDKTVTIFRGTTKIEKREIRVTGNLRWPWLMADERAVRQVLLNLLSNAAKFSEPDRLIEVRYETSPDGDIVISVIDQGIGMAPDQVSEATRPFYQADSRLARRYEGTGLGLSIVSGLVECHGGRLVIESQPDVGSRISVAFPPEAICLEATEITAAA